MIKLGLHFILSPNVFIPDFQVLAPKIEVNISIDVIITRKQQHEWQ